MDKINNICLLFCLYLLSRNAVCFAFATRECHVNNTKVYKDYWLKVESGQPQTLGGRKGSVAIKASVIGPYEDSEDCNWSFDVDGVIYITTCTNISKPYERVWSFTKPGLKVVKMTVQFSIGIPTKTHSLQNCTTINVTDCSRQLRLTVSTLATSFNVSKNQSKLTLDSPTSVNFSIAVFKKIDPFFICIPLSYNWNFGDGHYKTVKHCSISHFYNSSGTYNTSVKASAGQKITENIGLTVLVKERKHKNATGSSTTLEVSLVFAIGVTVIILVVFFVILIRKKGHKFTEVATFDFRHKEFQSEDGTSYCQPSFFKRNTNRRQEDAILLSERNSSYQTFDNPMPMEDF